MSGITIFLIILISVMAYIALTCLAIGVTYNRQDNTPLWEVILLSIILTPVLAIILEMLKPYRPTATVQINQNTTTDDKTKVKSNITVDDLTEEQKAELLRGIK